jgi:hypothetical protein
MICEICGQREATVHEMHIAGDVQKSRNMCEHCFQATAPAQAGDLAAAHRAGCRYCGGESYAGGGSLPSGPAGAHRISFMCQSCTGEYYRFLEYKMPGFVQCARTATVTEDLLIELRACDFLAILSQVEEHMKKWVAERGQR